MSRRFERAEDARRALIKRLGSRPRELKLAALELFAARLMVEFGDLATIKGGVAARLRLPLARLTEDVDVHLRHVLDDDELLTRLQRAAALDLEDFCLFAVQRDLSHPEIDAEDVMYGGQRYVVRCTMAGKTLGEFGVDVAFAEPMWRDPELCERATAFEVLALQLPAVRLYPLETQIAEKFYIYAKPRVGRPNSRTKDLPDLALLAGSRALQAASLRDVLERKFAHRIAVVRQRRPGFEFSLPRAVPALPQGKPGDYWRESYRRILIDQPDLPWSTLQECHEAVCSFLNPVLAGEDGTWSPERWAWMLAT